MKTFLILMFHVAFFPACLADSYDYAETRAEHAELFQQAQVAFEGHAEILGMRYLGEKGRVVTPEEVAASKPFMVDPLYYTEESPIRRIELRVRLVPERLLKGATPAEGPFEFTYTNSLIVLFTQHPRSLHQGKKMTFYILKSDKNQIIEIAYGDVGETSQKQAEQNAASDGDNPPK